MAKEPPVSLPLSLRWSLTMDDRALSTSDRTTLSAPLCVVTPTTDAFRSLARRACTSEDTVVELGSSYGGCSQVLHACARSYMGVDVSWECVEHCRRILPGAHFERSDILSDAAAARRLLERERPSLIAIDIGGNRALCDVLSLVEVVLCALHRSNTAPSLLLIKSEELAAEADTLLSCGGSNVLACPDGWWRALRRRSADRQRGVDSRLRTPTWYPQRTVAGVSQPICRFHNYVADGCKRHLSGDCSLDHEHCHFCLSTGHVARACQAFRATLLLSPQSLAASAELSETAVLSEAAGARSEASAADEASAVDAASAADEEASAADAASAADEEASAADAAVTPRADPRIMSALASAGLQRLVPAIASQPTLWADAAEWSRPALLAHLKAGGLALTESQAVANALGRARRAETLGVATVQPPSSSAPRPPAPRPPSPLSAAAAATAQSAASPPACRTAALPAGSTAATVPVGGSAARVRLAVGATDLLHFSPWNWLVSAERGVAITQSPGAYVCVSWVCADEAGNLEGDLGRNLELELDTSALTVPFLNIGYAMNGGADTKLLVPPGQRAATLVLTIPQAAADGAAADGAAADGAAADGAAADERRVHTLRLYVESSVQQLDRWGDGPHRPPACALRLRALTLPAGATAVPTPPRPRRLLVFGCSITEGVSATVVAGERCGDLLTNAASATWARAMADALDADYGAVGFGRQGWRVGGNGGVPCFHRPDSDGGASADAAAEASWRWLWAGVPRELGSGGGGGGGGGSGGGSNGGGGGMRPPEAVLVLHGTNDGLNGGKSDEVSEAVASWLAEARATLGPTPHLIICVPFGGFGGAEHLPRGALPAGLARYQRRAADGRAHLIDLGGDAAEGLSEFRIVRGRYAPTAESCDGIHPSALRHKQLGAKVAERVERILRRSGGGA